MKVCSDTKTVADLTMDEIAARNASKAWAEKCTPIDVDQPCDPIANSIENAWRDFLNDTLACDFCDGSGLIKPIVQLRVAQINKRKQKSVGIGPNSYAGN